MEASQVPAQMFGKLMSISGRHDVALYRALVISNRWNDSALERTLKAGAIRAISKSDLRKKLLRDSIPSRRRSGRWRISRVRHHGGIPGSA